MSDTTATPDVRTVEIKNPAELRKVANEYRIKFGERGRLPMRELSRVLIQDQLKGNIKCVDTSYFPISRWALGETVGTRKNKDDVSYVITYTVKGNDKSQTLTLTLTENEVRSYLPNVKGIVGGAFATMAVALHLNAEESGTPLTALLNYTVSDVKRIETPQSVAETSEEAPKGDDTGEQKVDADKAPETVPDGKIDEAPKVAVPVEVKTESKPRATTRTRAASAKTPAKNKTAKEKVSA